MKFLVFRLLVPIFLLFLGGGDLCRALDRDDFKVRCLEVIEFDERGEPLNYPRSLFYDPYDNEIYVVGSGKNQVVIFTTDFYPIISVGHGRGLKGVHSGVVDKKGTFFCLGAVGSEKNNFLVEYDRALLPAGKIELKGFVGEETFKPERVMIEDGFFYVVGIENPGLLKFDSAGAFLSRIVPYEEVLGVKEEAPVKSFVIDSAGRLFLLSEVMGRVYVYSRQGKFLFKFGIKGGSSGKLSRPRGLALDEKQGLVFVVDYMRHAVNVYSLEGKYLFEFGGKGRGRGWFAFPSDVCIDGQGHLWVADTFNSRVQVFEVSRRTSAGEKEHMEVRRPKAKLETPKPERPLRDDEVEERDL